MTKCLPFCATKQLPQATMTVERLTDPQTFLSHFNVSSMHSCEGSGVVSYHVASFSSKSPSKHHGYHHAHPTNSVPPLQFSAPFSMRSRARRRRRCSATLAAAAGPSMATRRVVLGETLCKGNWVAVQWRPCFTGFLVFFDLSPLFS